jgi:DNA modification methylase
LASVDTGILYCDDNLARLGELPDQSVDLIYLDPPFFSNRVYEVIWGDEAEVRSFEDRWEGGIQHYIGWMKDRVHQMCRILTPTGSLYLHCDPHASHYLKLMLDDVFGQSMFRNEIIWRRTGAHRTPRRFETIHDVIFFYTKGSSYTFNPIKRPYTKQHVQSRYGEDENGRLKFTTGGNILTGPGSSAGDSGQPWRGFDPSARHRHWAIPGYLAAQMPVGFEALSITQKLDALYEAGLIEIKRGAKWPHPVKFLDSGDGTFASDIWAYQPGTEGVLYGTDAGIDADVQWLAPKAAERLGYPTQKPKSLLGRIIEASSNPDDIVLDPFRDCGTTIEVAQRLRRQWVGIDISPTAMEIMRRRLWNETRTVPIIAGFPDTEASLRTLKPFEFQNWVINALNGTHSPRKVHDMGIDGYSFFEKHPIQLREASNPGQAVGQGRPERG